MRILWLAIGYLLLSINLPGQTPPCPSYEQQPITYLHTSHNRSTDIIIPVVFHVVQHLSTPEILEQNISNLLEVANKDFMINSNQTQYLPSGSTVGQVGFQFVLATADPKGNPTNGITFKETEVTKIGDQFSVENQVSFIKSSDFGGTDPWDTEHYINIWIGERTLSLGATITSTSFIEDREGIIISIEAALNFPKTLSHELGHFFGLLHPWGNTTGCDNEEDGISDTPFQAFPNFDCTSGQSCGVPYIPGNIMDFHPEECALFFTKQQAESMQQFAKQFKTNLLDAQDCFYKNLDFPFSPQIFVNSAQQVIEIYFEEGERAEKALLFDSQGKLIIAKIIDSESFLNIPYHGIPPGVYVFQWKTGKEYFAKKVIINR